MTSTAQSVKGENTDATLSTSPLDCRIIQNRQRGPIQVGIAENAGAGGLSVYLNEQVPGGNQLILEMYYRDNYEFSSLKLLTEVIWTSEEKENNGYKHGLRVLKLERGGDAKLRSLLKHCPILI